MLVTLRAKGKLNDALETVGTQFKEDLASYFPLWARAQQRPPLSDWTTWLVLGGRGAGKTRTGAEWIKGVATGDPHYCHQPCGRIALVGRTYSEAREVMVEGESGILAIHKASDRPSWIPSRRRLEWSNGAIASVYSSEDPEGLRGPQFGAAWCDDLAKWHQGEDAWEMLQFGLRLGEFPRQVVTTTPRPVKLLKRLIEDERTVVSRMRSSDNASNLAQGFLSRIVGHYKGTRLGRQELDGELIDDNPDALWDRDLIERLRVQHLDKRMRTVVAVDPPTTGTTSSDACGIVVATLDSFRAAYVLDDCSLRAVSPTAWASAACEAFHRWQADCLLVESNQGGDMAEAVLRAVDPDVPVHQMHASRSKWLRAEPVAALYEQGRVRHVGCFPNLEDEMCNFGIDGLSAGHSPDRLDAMVWAVSNLMLLPQGKPKIRTFN
ncbi:MAG: terminase family protein [Pseudomonadota bacterium]